MIPSLNIVKAGSGIYDVRIEEGGSQLDEFEAPTIAEAIREAAARGYGARGFHIWYGAICIGTTPVFAMRHDAETLALKLLSVASQF
jgi:hypothetical protein